MSKKHHKKGDLASKTTKQGDKKEAELIRKLEKDLEEANQKIEELTNVSQRAMADLQNFKRRTEEDKKNLVSFANVNLILEILPILDNFERAIKHQPKAAFDSKDWLEGIMQIYNQLQQFLEKQGLEQISAKGEKYNPNLHEAMLHVEGKDGIILDELEKGYILKGKIIRPTKVSVGNGQMEK